MVEPDFELRRARLTAEGQAGERWSGRIQMDFETERARFKLQANLDVLSPESHAPDQESAVRIQAQVVL